MREVPVADGGDGTLEAFLAAGFVRRDVTVTGPDNDPQPSAIALKGETAVVETALTSGLAMRGHRPPAPLTATSRGVGDAIRSALDAGARRIVVGLGGTASTDGGAGMLQALGARLLDASGVQLGPGGAGLLALSALDLSQLDPRLGQTEILLATDVANPLCGPNGAAAVYGPQKGADSCDVELLDRALARFAASAAPEAAQRPGAGAAGGIGFAAMAFLGASMRPGIELVLDLLDFERQLEDADLVVTGEGRLDSQSFEGKAPVGVRRAAARRGIPVVAVCGSNDLPAGARCPDFEAVHALTDIAADVPSAIANAEPLLRRIAARICTPAR